VALAIAAGAVHGASFPPLGMWPLAFVAFAPLIVAARGTRPLTGALLGWIAGTVGATIAGTPALTTATRAYFDCGPVAAVAFATLLGQVFHALPTTVFGACIGRLTRLETLPARAGTLAAAWTSLEFLRAHGLTGGGSPWDLLAHPLYAHPLWIQLADLGGVPLVSFVLMATAAAAAEIRMATWRALATVLALLGLTAAYGTWRLGQQDDGAPDLRIALVQGNVPNAWRTEAARAGDGFGALASATAPALAARPTLVIWPENAISTLVEPNARYAAEIARVLRPGGPSLLLGGPRFAQSVPGRVDFYNAAYLFSADGEILDVYDKRRLVPFAETAPIAWLHRAGDYSPGSGATIFATPAPFGVLICFEALYGDLARDLVRRGARFLVNISNDAWFDVSAGREQAFAMTVFRAVENRRALVRVTNTGVSGVVGPSGRVLARFPVGLRGAWDVRVPLRADAVPPYTVVGDTFAWLATGVFVAAWWRAAVRDGRGGRWRGPVDGDAAGPGASGIHRRPRAARRLRSVRDVGAGLRALAAREPLRSGQDGRDRGDSSR
jgi:apolipoprotein N-acyltransferase